MRVDPVQLPDGKRPTPDTRRRSTRALTEALTDGLTRTFQLKLGQWYKDVLAGIPLDERPVALALLNDTKSFRHTVRSLMRQPDFGLWIEVDRGPFADVRFVDRAELFVRLESVEALLRALDDQPANALIRWNDAGAMIEALAELPHGLTRASAARLRLEWLHVGQTIGNRPAATIEVLRGIQVTLAEQLQQWPADRRALVGDRAVGLVTYELLRDGHWMSLLPLTELQRLKQSRRLDKLAVYLGTRLDADQWYYLQTMRRLIDAAERPYFERRELLESIRKFQQDALGTEAYPWYAAEYLLHDVDELQRLMALDRTFTEGFREMVMAAATGKSESLPRHLETGNRLRWKTDAGHIVAENLEWPDDRTPVSIRRPVH